MGRIAENVAVCVLIAIWVLGGLACNTIRGAGKDIEKGGQKIQKAADSAQK